MTNLFLQVVTIMVKILKSLFVDLHYWLFARKKRKI